MTRQPPGARARWLDRFGRLSPLALGVLGIVVAAGLGGGGYWAYRTYDYVEHDNEFCLSCHLMAEPYERFAQSAHRDLGCKECHQPTLMERSGMALTQFLENPEELATHAEVPNGVCAACHIAGDPERWAIVAGTAGHQVHLVSDDPALEGLQCVECHASSLHEFAASDQTCAQSGCHTESTIRLAGMSDLTIHCAACHGFTRTVPTAGDAGPGGTGMGRDTEVAGASDTGVQAALAALSPDRDSCLGCHEMRLLVELPPDEPHQGACGACHQPHEQETPAEAAASCASAGCHTDMLESSPFHRGIDEAVLEGCTGCHGAHDFRLDGGACLQCHQVPDGPVGAVPAATSGRGAPERGPPGTVPFEHEVHGGVSCTSCHTSTTSHGEVAVRTVEDCRSCHHTERAGVSCAACHERERAGMGTYTLTRTLELSVGPMRPREVRFPHEAHASTDCATCHTEGLARSAEAVDCASCHQPHHEPQVDCAACHVRPTRGAHTIETAHVTCSGSGCHQDVPFEGLPRTRSVCLVCHQDRQNHQPGRNCAECHAMPSPRAGGGG